jgi:hypothetical protein
MAMDVRSIASRWSRTAAAGALALALPLAGFAADRTSGATLTVTAFPDRYVSVGVPFVDLDALDALVNPALPSVLQLDGCGPESANALLAAAERYRGTYLEIRMLAGSERACTAAATVSAVRVSQAGGAIPTRAAPAPTDRYWRSVMP